MIGDAYDLKVFDLLIQKKKNIVLAPLTSLEIPFGFRPKQISTYKMTVIVTLNENLAWHFPVEGITESRNLDITDVFKVSARTRIVKREMKL